MQRKRTAAVLLAGTLVLPAPYTNIMAADFSDGREEALADEGEVEEARDAKAEEAMFSSGDGEDAAQVQADGEEKEVSDTISDGTIETQVTIENVTYLYHEETDSYSVSAVQDASDGTVTILDEISGKKVTEIESGAMKECTALESVFIPASVTAIGEDLFLENAGAVIYGEEGSYVQEYALANGIPFAVNDAAAEDTDNMVIDGINYTYQEDTDSYTVSGYEEGIPSEAAVLSEVNGKAVTAVADGAFAECAALTKISIPGTVKSIGESAFARCTGLQEVTLETGVESLGDYVFYRCTGLKTVILPESVTSIGAYGFSFCSSLENLELPAGIEKIEANTFGDARYQGIFVVPEGVTSIEHNAFSSFGADGISLPSTLKTIDQQAFFGTYLEEITVPDSVTEIGARAFAYSDLQKVILGSGVRSIRSYTFSRCSKLTEVVLSDGVVEIGKYAFRNTGLIRINIPESVIRMHKLAFSGSSRVTLYVQAGSYGYRYARQRGIPYSADSMFEAVVQQDGLEFQYMSETDSYVLASVGEQAAGNVVIPERINGKKVTAILARAFQANKQITSVEIPDTVTSIGEYAFESCSLTSVKLPANITEIAAGVFENSQLTFVSIPDQVTSIGEEAFYNCSLETVDFSDSVQELGIRAFAVCSNLREIDLPDGIREIPEGCFQHCDLLERAGLPEGLEIIGKEAFQGTALADVEFPETLTAIEEEAFAYCGEIKEVTIPGSVKYVGYRIFAGCRALERAILEDGVEDLSTAFADCSNLKEIYIPDSVYSISLYPLGEGITIYGNTGSKAYLYCQEKGIAFVSLGTAVLEQPVIICEIEQGNNIHVALEARCDNADFYDYVIAESEDFPESGEALYQMNKSWNKERDWKNLDRGVYYLFVRSGRTLESGETEYSPWTMEKMTVSVQAPDAPVIRSVKVSGSTMTVTMDKVSGAVGYGVVLADHDALDSVQGLVEPVQLFYTSKNNRSTVYTFKNLRSYSYALFVRTYTKDANGVNVYSPWTQYKGNVSV